MNTPDVVRALAALAQETRLDIYRLLVRAGPGGLPAGSISDSLGVPGPTLSFHLKELKNAGVVKQRREGRSLIYAPDFVAMKNLVGFLNEKCCQGVDADQNPVRARSSRSKKKSTRCC